MGGGEKHMCIHSTYIKGLQVRAAGFKFKSAVWVRLFQRAQIKTFSDLISECSLAQFSGIFEPAAAERHNDPPFPPQQTFPRHNQSF